MTEKQVLKKLVEIRKQKKMTQKSLAKKIGIAMVNLSMIERGKTILTVRRFLQNAGGRVATNEKTQYKQKKNKRLH